MAIVPLIPLALPVLLELIKAVRDGIALMGDNTLTPEQKKAALDAIDARLEAGMLELEAYQFRTPPPISGT